MSPDEFIRKWRAADLKERSAAQEHFIDLCRLLDERTPAEADPTGTTYSFERGVSKTTGGDGWADVWKRGHFGWEYKGKRKDLNAAFVQLQQYALALENPPLLVVCDLERFVIHTNWTNSVSQVHELELEDLRDASKRELLKWVMSDPERLRPGTTREALTAKAAGEFAILANNLRERGHEPHHVAHFVNRLVFCMFAEDVQLLPNRMFSRMLKAAEDGGDFQALASSLFDAMRTGGMVGFERVEHFNGGLFDNSETLPLEPNDVALCRRVAALDWGEIDPSIFGTLFERGLDPDKRAQLGAHYTDRDKILKIVEPVIIRPWLAKWEQAKGAISEAQAKASSASTRVAQTKARNAALGIYRGFLDELRAFRVLDPACGSGNFLYVALRALKDLEHRAGLEAEALGLAREFPRTGPENVLGIELNPYAAELARVTVWIGEIQWMRRNGFSVPSHPVLRPLDNIICADAIINDDGSVPEWPTADVAIGNPPFLGDRRIVPVLGEDYASKLRAAYQSSVPAGADLVCYWFDRAREQIRAGSMQRAGFVATNSIRGGLNRTVLNAIRQQLSICEAWSNEPWIVDGAAVRVSLVMFAGDCEGQPILNGQPVRAIHSDLTAASADLTLAKALPENTGKAFQGVISYGPFQLTGDEARRLLLMPSNPNGRPNADVVRPWLNGRDLVRRPSDSWIVRFPSEMTEADAALYQEPFKVIEERVKPYRAAIRNADLNRHWWRLWRTRPELLAATEGLGRVLVTPRVSKHRIFVWRPTSVVPDTAVVAITVEEDALFGVLQSRFHEAWALRLGSSLEDRPRYTPSSTFETFPFPAGMTPDLSSTAIAALPLAQGIAEAAKRLDELRSVWLNPPELVRVEPEVVPGFPDRLLPRDKAAAKQLTKRTLTALYNERPTWLHNAHAELDAAVAAAYGWDADIPTERALERLLELNLERTQAAIAA